MPYIDIGANLTHHIYKNNLKEVLEDSKKWYVEKLIITGTKLSNIKDAQTISYKYPEYNIYYTSGVHPHNAKELNKSNFNIIEKLCLDTRCLAIGECGLDYDRMFSSKEEQLFWFEEQIKLSIKYNKPLFLHERDAFEDFYNILSKYKGQIRGVVHCFTGNKNQINKYLELGMYIGITGWICDDHRNKNLIEAIRMMDKKYLDRLMIETDCPFLSPIKEDKTNVPSYIYYVLLRLCKELNINEKELETILYNNTTKFFNL
jgi:TatD DNase family protein